MDVMVPAPQAQVLVESFDGPLGRRIIDTHIWAVRQGLRGAGAYDLFDGYCQLLVIHGVPLWRVHAAMETLHPQWAGYGYTWRRDLNAIQPEQYAREEFNDPQWLRSTMYDLVRRANEGENDPSMRRRLEAGPEQRDFPALEDYFSQGATDYFAQLFGFGEHGDRAHGTGVVYSFTTDRRGGFSDDDMTLLQATLPGLSLAIKADAGHVIASALLQTYLGTQTGKRVHAGAIERGSVESINAVLWYADIRGFTPTSDAYPGPVIIDLLDNVFETMAAALRSRGGEVLKFLGDGMLATLPFAEADRAATCQRALDAAVEAMRGLAALNVARAAANQPVATVDLALHVGEVLYGNVGAADRLDFTVVGPAVNEVARIEAWCEPLDRAVLISAEFAAAVQDTANRLVSLGRYDLRGIREAKEIFALASPAGS
ncbi:MAG TPA: adenylate/guanylate cyclase domain-containing protein [Xanthobacteraceae bacterium]|nr:adenylate/guanylate cyclase domain-containing protein [Xanthobacteraceae bacterium]